MIDAIFAQRLDSLYERLAENGGVLTIWMKELKELSGGMKLGRKVCARIEEHLAYRRIGFIGDHVPPNENAAVRLYLKGSPVARIIEAVEQEGASADQELREFAGNAISVTTRELIEEIRALLSNYDIH